MNRKDLDDLYAVATDYMWDLDYGDWWVDAGQSETIAIITPAVRKSGRTDLARLLASAPDLVEALSDLADVAVEMARDVLNKHQADYFDGTCGAIQLHGLNTPAWPCPEAARARQIIEEWG